MIKAHLFVRKHPKKGRTLEVIGDFEGDANIVIGYESFTKQIVMVEINNKAIFLRDLRDEQQTREKL